MYPYTTSVRIFGVPRHHNGGWSKESARLNCCLPVDTTAPAESESIPNCFTGGDRAVPSSKSRTNARVKVLALNCASHVDKCRNGFVPAPSGAAAMSFAR